MTRTLAFGMFLVACSPHLGIGDDSYRIQNPGPSAQDIPLILSFPKLEVGLYSVRTERANDTPPSSRFVEVVRDGDKTVARLILENLASGDSGIIVNPHDLSAIEDKPAIEFIPAGPNLEIRIKGKPFTTYRIDSGPKPILYPLLGVDEVPYTRSFPMEKVSGEDTDHPHQRSFWLTYGMVNGVDFWAELKGHGSIKETSRNIEGTGHIFKTLKTTDDWLDPNGKKLMEDERVLTFWATRTRRVIDVEVTFKASVGDVEFGDTKEGMFGVRVPSSMDVKNKTGGAIVNAEGIRDTQAWGKKSAWVDYSGPVQAGKTVGITIMEHPTSFGFPSPWHVRDYGLFAVNPFGKHDFGLTKQPTPTKLKKGDSLRFEYRVILQPGNTIVEEVRSQFEAFAHPPRILK